MIRCLAIDALLLRALAPVGMCIESRCLTVGPHVTMLISSSGSKSSHAFNSKEYATRRMSSVLKQATTETVSCIHLNEDDAYKTVVGSYAHSHMPVSSHNIHRNYQLCCCQLLRKCSAATATRKGKKEDLSLCLTN
jgi:hypothetical protein